MLSLVLGIYPRRFGGALLHKGRTSRLTSPLSRFHRGIVLSAANSRGFIAAPLKKEGPTCCPLPLLCRTPRNAPSVCPPLNLLRLLGAFVRRPHPSADSLPFVASRYRADSTLYFQQLTNCFFGNPFVFKNICVALCYFFPAFRISPASFVFTDLHAPIQYHGGGALYSSLVTRHFPLGSRSNA